MSKSSEELQKEIDELLELGKTGKLESKTCMMKVARKMLEQDGCEDMLHMIVAGLMSSEALVPLGIACHLLALRILRLEDDVRGLRGLIGKDRVETTQEQKDNVEYREEGKDDQA